MVKAACDLYLRDPAGRIIQLDRGKLRVTNMIILNPVPRYAHRSSLYSFSNVMSEVVVSGPGITDIYDFKREARLLTMPEIHSCQPLFIDGIPQLIGINKSTEQLEIM